MRTVVNKKLCKDDAARLTVPQTISLAKKKGNRNLNFTTLSVQNSPWNPSAQKHLSPDAVATQVPPLSQTFVVHCSLLAMHLQTKARNL